MDVCLFITSGLQVFLYTCTLVVVCKGVKHLKVLIMTILLLISSFARVLFLVFEIQIGSKENKMVWVVFYILMYTVEAATFSEAHWILAHSYYMTSKTINH